MLEPEELHRVAEDDLAFFSNRNNLARERWVVDRWLLARGVVGVYVRPGEDPPDFIVDGCGVEVVELLEPGRRRTDRYRAKRVTAEGGYALARRLVSRDRVVEHGHEWVLGAVDAKAKKYEERLSTPALRAKTSRSFAFASATPRQSRRIPWGHGLARRRGTSMAGDRSVQGEPAFAGPPPSDDELVGEVFGGAEVPLVRRLARECRMRHLRVVLLDEEGDQRFEMSHGVERVEVSH